MADKKPDCKCPDCGACKTCGAHPPQLVPYPYPVYPQMQPYRPYAPYPNTVRPHQWPYWPATSGSGTSANPPGGITYNA